MEKTNVTKRVTATILSMSLLTVMAGAAIAPALGIIGFRIQKLSFFARGYRRKENFMNYIITIYIIYI